MDGAVPKDFIFVTRTDTDEDYILIPFYKPGVRSYYTCAAIIVDGKTGEFKQASWVTEPTVYVQLTREEAIEEVIKAHPEATISGARLVWEPGGVTSSPFYPYWEVTAGEDTYYVK